ncbi:2-nitropropane dioxygenase [Dermatophilus congolensis]|uniref:Nitronate monooxygenase n=1 Tax=Dermatophilus congolensis TaxID=1863 RepID=A0A239VHG8_9MICO|nr:2-nitropropane dioxygenase [Dermatophilus congolensis]SNV21731.1 Nitronate monooxygenase [Dermatophilus congolensis]
MNTSLPTVIQGGMGVAISSWWMARKVAQTGQLGVVSGTAMDSVLARTLEDGDPGGHYRRALQHFPDQDMVKRALQTYYRPHGRNGAPYRPNPKITINISRKAVELAVLGNFAEVWLAKEGHDGPVGINFLEKIQMATPSAALGAMLAGVDYVLMGAGIPREIPALLRNYAAHKPATLTIDVANATCTHTTTLDPTSILSTPLPPLTRPHFLAIISLHSLATYLHRDEEIRPDGFIVEGATAGGHSAPPRGKLTLDHHGDPIYGPRDTPNLTAIARLGLPFWLAGGESTPQALKQAKQAGATGVQCGTIFALSNDSGLAPHILATLHHHLRTNTLTIRNDPRASPTGFPFKIATLTDTLSDPTVYEQRPRICDLSYLRTPYERPDGSIGYRCPAEPQDAYIKKGGDIAETIGRKCLCNALLTNHGLGQRRKTGYEEPPGVTLGQDLTGAQRLLDLYPNGWSAQTATHWLLSATRTPHNASDNHPQLISTRRHSSER